MRTEVERCEGEVRKLELKLEQARDLLSTETSQRKKAEQERDMMGQKNPILYFLRRISSNPKTFQLLTYLI